MHPHPLTHPLSCTCTCTPHHSRFQPIIPFTSKVTVIVVIVLADLTEGILRSTPRRQTLATTTTNIITITNTDTCDIHSLEMSAVPNQKEAAIDLIDWAHACLYADGELITYDRLLETLSAVPEAIKAEFRSNLSLWTAEGIRTAYEAVQVAKVAIADTERRSDKYRQNMRHFYEIACPKAYEEFVARSDKYDESVAASLRELHAFVDGVTVTTIPDRNFVLSAIKREWRALGWGEARVWEPLYELVTGRELVNE